MRHIVSRSSCGHRETILDQVVSPGAVMRKMITMLTSFVPTVLVGTMRAEPHGSRWLSQWTGQVRSR